MRGGRELVIDAGDPFPIAERFAVAGEIAVVDLDAALGQGSNAGVMRELAKRFSCRVAGGIRDVESALKWMDEGATKVVLGTAATPEVLSKLPRERVVAALDAEDGDVVVEGWRKKTGRGVVERIGELRELVSGFLVTMVEREGRMGGADLARSAEIVKAAGDGVRVTIAGGVTTAEEVAALDRLGADAQVGMALYSGRMDLGDAVCAPMTGDRPDGLWPTVVADERGVALGLTYSNAESVRAAVKERRGVYWSRKRGLWRKGETSGHVQELLRVDLDCDRDALRFTVRQKGEGFCHLRARTCWGEDRGLGAAAERISERAAGAPAGSYTARLLNEPALLRAKLIEEAGELADAEVKGHVAAEAADVMYFALVAMQRAGVALEEVERELARRQLKVTRRAGDAKPGAGGGA